MAMYFGFALADSMFSGNCIIQRQSLTVEQVKQLVESGDIIPCLNPSHEATVEAMKTKFGINIPIPSSPPQIALSAGDSVIVMGVRGLPRLTDRHHYSEQEVAKATFLFAQYSVQ